MYRGLERCWPSLVSQWILLDKFLNWVGIMAVVELQANIKNHELGFSMKGPVLQSHTRQICQSHTSVTYTLRSTQMPHQFLGKKKFHQMRKARLLILWHVGVYLKEAFSFYFKSWGNVSSFHTCMLVFINKYEYVNICSWIFLRGFQFQQPTPYKN